MLLDFCQKVSGVVEPLEVPNVQIVQKTKKGVLMNIEILVEQLVYLTKVNGRYIYYGI